MQVGDYVVPTFPTVRKYVGKVAEIQQLGSTEFHAVKVVWQGTATDAGTYFLQAELDVVSEKVALGILLSG